ncbi:MAG TPA: isoprenylcysteine carboxylmethyltransferase family protein [Halanaerobiales bacterium]|nr:isoprenylcysteine carboxylmethyltransferase family protein [Halanaerobiales bacterium]
MNSFILVIPIIFIRYILIRIISDEEAIERAGFFPPTEGKEQVAFYVYQITTLILLIYLFFSNIKFNIVLSYVGLIVFIIGMLLYIKSIIDFSKPQESGINNNGLYKYSRNPMYVAFFLYFLGCSFLINSLFYFIILLIFQISVHYLILSEERWCIKEFGVEYQKYMKKVRRYI